jgi:20S proteasome alpha/beta subunit
MTLIIGIKCKDGVVLGADGATTFTNVVGQPTVTVPAKKLQVLSGSVIVGVSGDVGLAQMFAKAIGDAWQRREFSGKSPNETGQLLRQAIWKQLAPEVIIAKQAAEAFGQGSIQRVVTCSAVALPVSDTHCLFQFDHQGIPTEATPGLPFFALGSGQMIADTFLAFLRKVFWPQRPPELAEGLLAAVWTLRRAIETTPGGVGDPIQITTLCREGKSWVARERREEEWQEHLQDIQDAEGVLRDFRRHLQPKDSEGKPTAPPPPPAPPKT